METTDEVTPAILDCTRRVTERKISRTAYHSPGSLTYFVCGRFGWRASQWLARHNLYWDITDCRRR